MDLSVVVPVYNEEEGLPALFSRLKEVLAETDRSCELVFVDDGSGDRSLQVLQELKSASRNSPPTQIVQLARNFGQHPALIAGFSVARGRVLITLDADLQIDPGYILPMLDKIDRGCDFVSGVRRGRGDSFFLRRLPSRILNLIIGAVVGKKLADYGCPLNAMKAEIAKAMQDYGEMQRLIKPLAIKLSHHIGETEVRHQRRHSGRSKYGFLSLVDLLFDFVTNFSRQLFQRVTLAGLTLSVSSFLCEVIYLFLRFPLGWLREPLNRLQVVCFTAFGFGMGLVVLGVLGDFVIRIYRRLEPRPIYDIKKIW